LRFALAAVIVVAASFGGAAFVSHASAGNETAILADGTRVAGLDLSLLQGLDRDPNREMLSTAFEKVERGYYKPVNNQVLLSGERKGLLTLLAARKVSSPTLPALAATGETAHDLTLAQSEVTAAYSAYPKAATTQEYAEAAVAGMLSALGDPYTTYLSKREIAGLEEQLQGGNFGGIGVYIVQDPKTGAILVDPIEGNPAIKAGLLPGDTILAVDSHSTMGEKLDDVEREIRGPLGTVVTLRVKHHAESGAKTYRVTRADIHVPSVQAKMEQGIDYVRLADFGTTSGQEVRTAMLAGKKAGARGYILDLRYNGGGLVDAAVDISSLFIPQGTIVSTIDRAGNRDTRSATGDDIGVTPLVVLVNKYTASASEITAGAIQDYRVGTIIGTKTFGKGVVQSLYNLPDHGALKITTSRYVTPKGRDIQHKGITPDIIVDQRVDLPIIGTSADKQLAAAKALIRKKDAQ
jgi:carboxyl-terminal processing protease